MNPLKKISHLKSALEKLGISLSLDNLRKLEKVGIVVVTRSKGGHRWLTDEQFKRSMKNLLLYYFNTPIKEILSNPTVVENRVKLIRKALKTITK